MGFNLDRQVPMKMEPIGFRNVGF